MKDQNKLFTLDEKHLIIGGGLAGISLAHRMEDAGKDFLIVDSGVNHSTSIAAGMINPMVFRTMVKTWKADELFPELIKFYRHLELKVKQNFLFNRSIKRIFSTAHERKLWNERLNDDSYAPYISPSSPIMPEWLDANFGAGTVLTPGYIDSELFLRCNHHYFQTKGKMQKADFNGLKLDESNLNYDGIKYKSITFCEGYKGKDNPYFGYLPLQQTKGEILEVTSNDFQKTEILNRKCFVLPTEAGTFKIGATFAWNTTNLSPTITAKTELQEQLASFSKASYTIINQQAGIRPTVTDRRPLLGEHPIHRGLFIFNGLGTKGYMLAPYFSGQLSRRILHGETLDSEVDIKRFYSKHYK
ncbi:MAG: FAD-binding oxidoreductase [Crocinitomicaceae bacterium]|nr:FAD-binding oxidoreductase [Crocinitomicaceae bacterium]